MARIEVECTKMILVGNRYVNYAGNCTCLLNFNALLAAYISDRGLLCSNEMFLIYLYFHIPEGQSTIKFYLRITAQIIRSVNVDLFTLIQILSKLNG